MPRRISRAAALPSSRAVVGGLLIATSALMLFSAYRSATSPPTDRWLIVERDIAQGSTIEASDLALAVMELHPRTEERAIAVPEDAIGHVARESLRSGDLVLRSDLARDGTLANPTRRIGMELDLADALNGDLVVGDTVDVVAKSGGEAGSDVIAVATITAIADPRADGIGSANRVRLTVSVPDVEAARAITDAQQVDGVLLLGAGPSESSEA